MFWFALLGFFIVLSIVFGVIAAYKYSFEGAACFVYVMTGIAACSIAIATCVCTSSVISYNAATPQIERSIKIAQAAYDDVAKMSDSTAKGFPSEQDFLKSLKSNFLFVLPGLKSQEIVVNKTNRLKECRDTITSWQLEKEKNIANLKFHQNRLFSCTLVDPILPAE